jgi:hypothetical protein
MLIGDDLDPWQIVSCDLQINQVDYRRPRFAPVAAQAGPVDLFGADGAKLRRGNQGGIRSGSTRPGKGAERALLSGWLITTGN